MERYLRFYLRFLMALLLALAIFNGVVAGLFAFAGGGLTIGLRVLHVAEFLILSVISFAISQGIRNRF